MNKILQTFLFAILLSTLILSNGCNRSFGQNKNHLRKKKESLSVSQAIELNRGSIVQIIARLTPQQMTMTNSPIVVLGSGFVISEGYVITALHVLKGVPPNQIFVALPMPYSENMRGNYSSATIEIVEQDSQHDLALLRIRQSEPSPVINDKTVKLPQSIAKLDIERPKDGTQIVTSGYPLNIHILVSSIGWIASSWDISTSQLGNLQNLQIPQFSDSYLLNMTVNHGNSGGPVYSAETGKVIGVCVAFKPARIEGAGNAPLFYNSGISIAVPSKYVVEMLKKHNIKVAE